MTPSPFQQAIYDAVVETLDSLIIEAVAGSGKTTTLVELVSRLSGDYRFLAFNKAIADELKARGVEKASTFHSLMLSEITSRLSPRPKVESSKTKQLFSQICPEDQRDDYYQVIKLVSLAKNSALTGCEDNSPWLDLIDEFDLEFPSNDHAVAMACRLLDLSNRRLDIIDFDDMLYIPYIKNWSLRKYPTVLIDEAQDTNALQLALLTRITSGRVIAVGDQAQAIYGFRGAGRGSMGFIQTAFKCSPLPLSISYRCPREVVHYAQRFVPAIQSHEAAIDGLVASLPDWELRHIAPGSVVICRVNRPLVKLAYQFIRAGVSVQMLGRDLGSGLKKILKPHKLKPFHLLLDAIVVERDRKVAAAQAKSRTKAIAVEDAYNSLLAILESAPDESNFDSLNTTIDKIFAINPAATVTLCTVHRAKGLEWRTVYILDRDKYMPHPRAPKEGWGLQQEHNLMYVAATRAKENLFFINSKES